ncbi:MAG: TRAP transporter substrate-binding protein [bacterium]|nr:TRAP transporter substrate-binding protein [bacterium]
MFVFIAVILPLEGFADSSTQKIDGGNNYSKQLTGIKDQIVLTLAHGMNPKHPVAIGMRFFAKRVKELSKDKIIIHIFPNGQLGNEVDLTQQVQLGCIDMMKTSASAMEGFVPEFSVLSLPYLFIDEAHYWKILKGPIGNSILNSGLSVGLKGLTFYDAGARSFYTKNKPILKPEDLKGMKIRTQSSPTSIEMIKVLGGSPTPIPYGSLYTALQQGVVDGAENNIPSLYSSRQYETVKYFALDEHTMTPDVLMISKIVWEKLPKVAQSILLQAAKESLDFQIKLWNKVSKEDLVKIEKSGVKVFQVNKKPFQEKVKPMYARYKGTKIGALINKIKEAE